MARKTTEDLKRIHLWLHAEDIDFLTMAYRDTIGVSKAIRVLVHAHVKAVRNKQDLQTKQSTIDIGEIDV